MKRSFVGRRRVPLLLSLALALCPAVRASADQTSVSEAKPPLVSAVERRFGDFFLFTTKDGASFEIYQLVNDRTALPAGAEVVCLFNQCFFKIVTTSEAQLMAAEKSGTQTFRAVQDSYRLMRRASADDKPAATQQWREQLNLLNCAITKSAC